MNISPCELPLHLAQVKTSRGDWGIFVDNVVETQDGSKLLVRIILEQSVDEESFRVRRLSMTALAVELRDQTRLGDATGRIRDWIETTDGDGYFDLT